ncbi:ATP-binding protein [Hymenobacter caeli]|uniref:histidine kinase n=1 Tax=Hymenobacter caeli TaxID=2735894 RepID=A0ABX2FVL6_9BACT|nr:ATP-binding protein [Hymenobacter caeli]NRT21056.1 signal transduction histidine kinase/DNA-binding response OmpR family regulator [Hymenobacter caeli]
MKIRCLLILALLVGHGLLGRPAARAAGRPVLRSAAPASALLLLRAALVNAPAMQRLDDTGRWRYQPGQPPGWASPATPDQGWPLADPNFLVEAPPPGWRGLGCFRLRFTLDSALLGQPLGLAIVQQGASDIYLDGQRLGSIGTVGTSAQTTRGLSPRYLTLPFLLRTAGPHLLAVRYARFGAWPPPYGGFALRVAPAVRLQAEQIRLMRVRSLHLMVITGTGLLALLHFFLFLFYRPQRANLYFSLYAGALMGTALVVYFRSTESDVALLQWLQLGFAVAQAVNSVLLLVFLYSVCEGHLPWRWLALVGLLRAALVAMWLAQPAAQAQEWPHQPLLAAIFLLPWLDMLRVLGRAWRRGRPGIGPVAVGVVATILVQVFAAYDVFHVWVRYYSLAQLLTIQLGFLLLPVCMSVYLAREFAATRRHLEAQLRQVEQLSAQTLAQETERRRLVSAQNERLEATVRARTEEISQQNHVLAAQKDEITAQADRLRALDQEKTRFFTNITHEFRTPLTLMLGPAAQIAADTREPATRQQAALVQRNAQRLLHLINQLLDLGRLEAGQQALALAPGDAVAFVRGLVGSFESLAEQRGIGYSFEADRPVLPAAFDADKLEKILVNLLANAFKFTPSAGTVAVGLRVAGTEGAPGAPAWLELTVRDTGCGIAAAQLPHVFDRFYQADASDTRAHEGSGIGLALTKELVELHGGTIALASEPGRGTTATVRLPLRPAAEAAPASLAPAEAPAKPALRAVALPAADAADAADAPAPGPAPAPDAPLVLLIEDNADVRAYLRAVLGPAYHLLEAEDGEAGVALAREHLPDLVLTDAMMPRLDGYGVCRALKEDERTSHIPIVLLTAKADLPSRLQGLDTGADAYLTKPFRREELLAQLRNLVHGRQQLQEAYRRAVADAPPPGPPTLEEAFLARVRAAVELALDDEALDVEALAHALALSRTQLHRKLKALTGHAPGDFIRLVRLTHAHELLAGGAATVAEAGYRVGYGNPANFSTSFSRHFGYPPSEARPRAAAVSS